MPEKVMIDVEKITAKNPGNLVVNPVPGNPNAVQVTETPLDPLAPKPGEAPKPDEPAKGTEPEKKPDEPVKPKEPEKKPDEDPEKKIVEGAGLDYQAIVEEYRTNQSLTPETMGKVKEAVKKAGLPEEVVDAYFQNMKAQEELFAQQAYVMVGGQEAFNDMAAWARSYLSEKELKTFSDLAEKGDPDQAMMAIRLLHSQYKQAVQTGGTRIKGDSGAAPGEGGLIRSQAELAELMGTPEYAKSPTRRREIQERMARSVAAGVLK